MKQYECRLAGLTFLLLAGIFNDLKYLGVALACVTIATILVLFADSFSTD